MTRHRLTLGLVALLVAGASPASAQEVGMFGNTPSRNMASDETGLPSEWDASTGMNVLWSQPVGSQAYGGPTIANGRVYVGTNNEGRRDPSIEGDKGVVMAFDAETGEFPLADGARQALRRAGQRLAVAGSMFHGVHGGGPDLLRLQPGARRLSG